MKVLALDSSTEACSAAVLDGGEPIERFTVASQQHTRLLPAMVAEVLSQASLDLADIDLLAVANGPGSFTGIRIALGIAQGIAASTGVRVVGVSTLAAVAQRVIREQGVDRVACAMDARMGQIYWGLYRRDLSGLVVPMTPDSLVTPDQIEALPRGDWCGAGTGWRRHSELLRRHSGIPDRAISEDALPHAAEVCRLAARAITQAVAAAELQPVYLRDTVAKKTSERS